MDTWERKFTVNSLQLTASEGRAAGDQRLVNREQEKGGAEEKIGPVRSLLRWAGGMTILGRG